MINNLILVQFQLLKLVVSKQVEQACDVEGSGADDCTDHCCNQSICESIYNPENNQDKRCCTKDERQQDPQPSDCTPCTVCCDEKERRKTPKPKYCSNCPRCDQLISVRIGNLQGKYDAHNFCG